jgi:hypothetical protein
VAKPIAVPNQAGWASYVTNARIIALEPKLLAIRETFFKEHSL